MLHLFLTCSCCLGTVSLAEYYDVWAIIAICCWCFLDLDSFSSLRNSSCWFWDFLTVYIYIYRIYIYIFVYLMMPYVSTQFDEATVVVCYIDVSLYLNAKPVVCRAGLQRFRQ